MVKIERPAQKAPCRSRRAECCAPGCLSNFPSSRRQFRRCRQQLRTHQQGRFRHGSPILLWLWSHVGRASAEGGVLCWLLKVLAFNISRQNSATKTSQPQSRLAHGTGQITVELIDPVLRRPGVCLRPLFPLISRLSAAFSGTALEDWRPIENQPSHPHRVVLELRKRVPPLSFLSPKGGVVGKLSVHLPGVVGPVKPHVRGATCQREAFCEAGG